MYIDPEARGIFALFATVFFVLPGLVGAFSPLVDPADANAWWYIPARVGSLFLIAFGLWCYWSLFKSSQKDKRRSH